MTDSPGASFAESAAPRRRGARIAVALTAALAAFALVALFAWRSSSPPATGNPEGEPLELSLLALGDTGKRHRWIADWTEGQLAVAQGMIAEDRREPVDALIFLGDNFYMKGLEAHELVARVKQNVVRPYCHFLDLSGPRSGEVEAACEEPRELRNPVPLYAVLGNHDLISPESPRLQYEVLPQLVPGWRLGNENAEVHELHGGVSLILLRSDVRETKVSPRVLTAALRRSRGPWRIVAAHRPAAIDDLGGVPPDASYYKHVREASRRSGVAVHVFLGGHHHSLQLIELEAPAPSLNVVAGSGSRGRPILGEHPGRRFGAGTLGFARIDLVGRGDQARLVASLFATPSWPLLTRSAPELVARWSVRLDGSTRDEFLEP